MEQTEETLCALISVLTAHLVKGKRSEEKGADLFSGSKIGAEQKRLPLWVWPTRASTIVDKQSLGRPAATRKQDRLAWCTMHDLSAALTRETDVVFEYFDR